MLDEEYITARLCAAGETGLSEAIFSMNVLAHSTDRFSTQPSSRRAVKQKSHLDGELKPGPTSRDLVHAGPAAGRPYDCVATDGRRTEPLPRPRNLPTSASSWAMVVGLGVTRLLSGVARIVQHPSQYKLYPRASRLGRLGAA